MYKFDNSELNQDERSPIKSLLLFAGMLFLGFVGANFIALIVSTPFFNGDMSTIGKVLENPLDYKGYSFGLMILQGVTALVGFVAIPVLYIYSVEKKNISYLDSEHNKDLHLNQIILIVVIMLSAMPLVSVLGEWNNNISFPESLSGLEETFQNYETRARDITVALISVNSIPNIILAFVVVGMIAAIGEELVFRGILQNIFLKMLKNKHAAVLLAAFIFSAFHMQFYGFFPRFFLGVLLGYLYLWSGNFMVPVIGHFLNNSVTLIAVYTNSEGNVEEMINQESNFPWYLVALSTLVMISGLVVFKQKFEK